MLTIKIITAAVVGLGLVAWMLTTPTALELAYVVFVGLTA